MKLTEFGTITITAPNDVKVEGAGFIGYPRDAYKSDNHYAAATLRAIADALEADATTENNTYQ